MHAYAHCYRKAYTSCVMCDRDTIQFVMFTVWMFTSVGASHSHLCNSTAFLLAVRRYASVVLAVDLRVCVSVCYKLALDWSTYEQASKYRPSTVHNLEQVPSIAGMGPTVLNSFIYSFIHSMSACAPLYRHTFGNWSGS